MHRQPSTIQNDEHFGRHVFTSIDKNYIVGEISSTSERSMQKDDASIIMRHIAELQTILKLRHYKQKNCMQHKLLVLCQLIRLKLSTICLLS